MNFGEVERRRGEENGREREIERVKGNPVCFLVSLWHYQDRVPVFTGTSSEFSNSNFSV